MASRGGGKCNRCGAAHKNLMMRGPCQSCLDKEQERIMMDRIATAEKLRQHPDLAELDVQLDGFYE